MANSEYLAKLNEGVEAWNQWRIENPNIEVDLVKATLGQKVLGRVNLRRANLAKADFCRAYLSGANLSRANLGGADLSEANLHKADLSGARLRGADLSRADLSEVDLRRADLHEAHLNRADLSGVDLSEAYLSYAHLSRAYLNRAKLSRAHLYGAHLNEALLSGADLHRVNLSGADLSGADLSGANLNGADLSRACLIGTNFEGADLTGCNVYGISAWDVRLEKAVQSNLVITPSTETAIQVDNLEVAQFVYLLLNNEKIRHVIDTITSKVVLILGRFAPGRRAILDAIRDELRKRDYLPILFDFEKPGSKDLTGTVMTLANMARFIIADLTDPSSVPHELATIAPNTLVPIQAILLIGQRDYAMFPDLQHRHHWVLEPYQYDSESTLLASLGERVIAPAEAKVKELRRG